MSDQVSYPPQDLAGYMTVDSANAALATMQADIAAAKAGVKALPNVTIAGTVVLGALSGPKKHTLACVGVQPTDRIQINPISTMPVGYMLGDVGCFVVDQIEITLQVPAVLGAYSIPVRVTALRPIA